MVDKVVPSKIISSRPDSNSLRSSFKSASSGLYVAKRQDAQAAAVVQTSTHNVTDHKRANFIAKRLREAVDHSGLALKALKQVSELGSASVTTGNIGSLADELDKVQKDIHDALSTLKDRADAVDILSENLSSSDVRLDEVEAAKAHAKDTGSYIRLYKAQAIDAHSNLNAESVESLLSDE